MIIIRQKWIKRWLHHVNKSMAAHVANSMVERDGWNELFVLFENEIL